MATKSQLEQKLVEMDAELGAYRMMVFHERPEDVGRVVADICGIIENLAQAEDEYSTPTLLAYFGEVALKHQYAAEQLRAAGLVISKHFATQERARPAPEMLGEDGAPPPKPNTRKIA